MKELKSRFTEIAYNDKQDDDEPEINWKYWASLSNIKPRQAAKLAYHINPRTYPGNDYRYGVLPKALTDKIDNLEQFLEGLASTWVLNDLVVVLGADFAPHGMVEAARAQALQQGIGTQSKNESAANVGAVLTKLQKQHAAILKVIEGKEYEPMAIPDGEKGVIQMICENDFKDLFDKYSSFDTAWKKGRTQFKMANHASFSRRGK